MLLDTSGLFCCFVADDLKHAEAAVYYDSAPIKVTHNYVLAEFVSLTHSRRLARGPALSFLQTIEATPRVEVVWVDRELHRAAREMLETHRDKEYSLCDAVSFVLMRQRNILEALTTDRHFEQAGFVRLLK